MHPITEQIWRKHEAWLKEGGDSALDVVKTSNLIALIDQGVERAEASGIEAARRRGYKEGHAAGHAAALAPAPIEPPPAPPGGPGVAGGQGPGVPTG